METKFSEITGPTWQWEDLRYLQEIHSEGEDKKENKVRDD